MNTSIKILIAEHDQHDVEMIATELKAGGIDFKSQIVQSEANYRNALENFIPDIILCDYSFPSFDGQTAFKIREEIAPETPFILVSGTIGEENSIELIKNGVTDFVLKDKMFTLNTKLLRALKDARERKEKNATASDLKKTAAHLAEAQNLAKLGSWDYDIVEDKLNWSGQLYKVFDIEKQDFGETHSSFLHLVDEADREFAASTSRRTQETGDRFIIEYGITTPTGEKRVIEEHGYGVKDAAGKVIRLFGTAQDITERKKSAEALKKAYDEKNAVLESIDDGFFATDKNSLVTYWNRKAELLLDVRREDMLGKNIHEIFADSRSAIFYDNYQKAIRENSTVRFEGFSVRSDKWFSVSAFASENGLSVYFKDVTEQKKDEEKLRISESRYRQIVETAQEGIWLIDENNQTTFVNDKMCQILGYDRAEIIGRTNLSFKTAEEQTVALQQIERRKRGIKETHEAKFITKTGRHILTSISTNPLLDNEGLYAGTLAMVTDITESKKAEKRDQFQATLLNTIGQAAIATNLQGKINYWNKAAAAIYGWTEDEVLGKNIIDISPAQQTKAQAEEIMQELLRGNTWSGEFMVRRKDGCEFPAFVTNTPIFDKHQQLIGIIGVSNDITKRKEAELQLKESNERYNLISQATNDMVWDWNLVTGKVYRNKEGWKKIFRTGDEAIENDSMDNWNSRLHPDDIEKVKIIIAEIRSSTKDFFEIECRVLRNDGTYAFIHDRGNIIRNEQGMAIRLIGATQDITERKKAEQQLNTQERRYRALVENGADAVVILTPEGKLKYASPTVEKILGYTEEEIYRMDMFAFIHPDDVPAITKVWEQVLASPGIPFSAHKVTMLHKNGSWRCMEATITNMLQDTALNGIVKNFRDVTEKIEAEQLREFERIDKEALINTTTDLMWSVTTDYRLIAANKAFITYMRHFYPKKLRPGDDLLVKEKFTPGYLATWQGLYNSSIMGESVVKEMHIPGDGTNREQWFETTLHPIYNYKKVTGIACYSRDITERKQSEILLKELNEDLQKHAKELVLSNAELEQFAYVASHDLQEPLRMVTSFLTLLEKKYGPVIDDRGKQYIDFAVDGAKRMRQILLDLLEFSRVGRTADQEELINLNELVEEIKILCRKQILEKHAVITMDHLPDICGYRSPLRQVFQNLIGNSLKYTAKGRAVEINIACTEFKDHWQFAVRDNGIGINKEYFDKIFIIFQRLHNKDEFSGTGMGLAITKKILENQGARIWVESEEEKGSTFYFSLLKK